MNSSVNLCRVLVKRRVIHRLDGFKSQAQSINHMEKLNIETQPELRCPLHLVRCLGELAAMYCKEIVYKVDQALDAAWPDDAPEDQTIKSGRWS